MMNDRIFEEPGPMVEEDYRNVRGEQPVMEKAYKPNKQEILKEYELRVRFLSVGCVVSVGCKDIPFRSVKEAMEEVNKYVNNPYEEGQKWRKLFETEE